MEREIITSRQNRSVVLLSKLEEKKHRDGEGLFRYDGIKLFCESIRCGLENEYIFLRESSADRIEARLEEMGICDLSKCAKRIIYLSDDLFSKISSEKSPEGIICVSKYIDKFHKIIKINNRQDEEDQILHYNNKNERIFMIESVRDPGNLGTIIRTAYALGIDRLIMSSDCADIYNPKTIRAAMGSLFGMRIVRTDDIISEVGKLRSCGRRALATALDRNAAPFGELELRRSDVIVIGNEGHGISAEMIDACDTCVYIPMRDGAESLNAAMAATICIWEISRCNN